MSAQSIVGVDDAQRSAMRLPRSLSVLETWGFGLTAHTGWITVAPAIHAALGPKAMFVWLPGLLVGMLLNLQVQRLGMCWPEMSGGTPNYAARLLKKYPLLARYVALGYFVGWAAAPAVMATILTDSIQANLESLGLTCPEALLNIGFTCIVFVVAFSGTRALAILHLFFLIPAIGFILAFSVEGLWWLIFSPASPGLLPPVETLHANSWHFQDWAKFYFIATWNLYGCETTSSFAADSRHPAKTLRFLTFAAWLMPVTHLGVSWILMRLATVPGLGDSTYLNLLAAAKPFWGQSTSLLVTLLIAFSCFLNSATSVCVLPRILYQLSLDGYLSPVFAVISKRGVLGPSLLFTLLIALLSLVWGDVARIVMISNTGYFACITGIHLGLWLRRDRPEVLWPWWSAGFFILGAIVLVAGGLAWGWQDWVIGLFLPVGIMVFDTAIDRISFPLFHPQWWLQLYKAQTERKFKDFIAVQVIVLLVLVCGAATISWVFQANIGKDFKGELFVILLITIAFVSIAIACWTTLPQIASIAEAREQAENLFITALDTVPDTILVLDKNGVILQTNPAAEKLFGRNADRLIGYHLGELLPELFGTPEQWPNLSEQTLQPANKNSRIVEATISHRTNRQIEEYIVILRDITERKQSEEALRQSEEIARKQATQLEQTLQNLKTTQSQLIQTEKMSSLGQLVAGVAHEINNPVNFIHGNLVHVDKYSQDLINLIELYQQRHPKDDAEIENFIAEIELEFLLEDLPKTLSSMKLGANRIREIVLSLRNFSRLDEADMKTVNIHEGIDSSLLILQNAIKGKLAFPSIIISKEYGELPQVECYPGQLNQVFMNILSNAIYALHKRDKERGKEERENQPSRIAIATQIISPNWLRISIKDNGPGISESILPRIFDPFFTTKPVGSGTGLGLAISYQIIVEKHGGKLWCTSSPGEGAEFVIEIPIKQKFS